MKKQGNRFKKKKKRGQEKEGLQKLKPGNY